MSREATFTEIVRSQTDAETTFVMDEETFRGFYDRTARGLWLYLSRITGDPQKADDLLQETFYRFLRADASHESEAHRRNSLFRIATNLARDAKRRNVARPEGDVAGHDIEAIPSGPGTPELSTDFSMAMSRLKPRERAMLWLAYAEGASHREIAEVLGLQPGSLKHLLFRARHKLAGLLGRTEAKHAVR
jgi:RNA polymerase sigma-70 factor (ECF subfamily)